MKHAEDAVDDTGFLKQGLPRECAEQEIHPHRKDEDEDDETTASDVSVSQNHCKRVGEHKTDDGAHKGQSEGQPECLDVLRRGDREDVCECERSALVGQSVEHDQGKRDDRKADHPQNVRSG